MIHHTAGLHYSNEIFYDGNTLYAILRHESDGTAAGYTHRSGSGVGEYTSKYIHYEMKKRNS